MRTLVNRDTIFRIVVGAGFLIFGLWLGLIGWEEITNGPQGYGLYQITYPLPGIPMAILGGLAMIGGLFSYARGNRAIEPSVVVSQPLSQSQLLNQSVSIADSQNLKWKFPKTREGYFELLDNYVPVAVLAWHSDFGSDASAKTATSRYKIIREGVVKRNFIVKDFDLEQELARFQAKGFTGGVIRFSNGAEFNIKRKGSWTITFDIQNEQGKNIVSITHKAADVLGEAEVKISADAIEKDYVPVLVILTWHAIYLVGNNHIGSLKPVSVERTR